MWKDDKKRYEKFLCSLSWNEKNEVIQKKTLNDASIFTIIIEMFEDDWNSWRNEYMRSEWFKDYYIYLENEILFERSAKVLRKIFDHRIDSTDLLWICHKDTFLSCISEEKIVSILRKVHDNSDHWNKIITLIKLRNMIYWSDQSENVKRYIAKCIQCARHESVIKSQSLHSI